MPLETFYDDWTNSLCTGAHQIFVMRYSLKTECLSDAFSYSYATLTIMEVAYIFDMLSNRLQAQVSKWDYSSRPIRRSLTDAPISD